MLNFWTVRIFLLSALMWLSAAFAQDKIEYTLGAGDSIKILVFQNPELTVETRVSENGTITYPLLGSVSLGGRSIGAAEQLIAEGLVKGQFVRKPQVNIILLTVRGNQISILGQVNRPGRFPLETFNTRVSDMLASAGGAISGSSSNPGGGDIAIITGTRSGQIFRKEIDIPSLYIGSPSDDDILLEGGDTIYVARAPVFYVYGEIQRPGVYRIERGLTVMQALATGGGPTARGSDKRLQLNRKKLNGGIEKIDPLMSDPIFPNDVLFVRESFF